MTETNATYTQTAQKAEHVSPQSPKASDIRAAGDDLMARQNEKAALTPRRRLLEADLALLRTFSPPIKADSLVQEMASLDMKSGAIEAQMKELEARIRALMAEAEVERRKQEEKAVKETRDLKQAQQPKPDSGTKTLLKIGAAAVGAAALARALTPKGPLSRGLVRRSGAYRNLVVQEGPAPRPIRRNGFVMLAGGSRARFSPLMAAAGLAGTLAAASALAVNAGPSLSSSSGPSAPAPV